MNTFIRYLLICLFLASAAACSSDDSSSGSSTSTADDVSGAEGNQVQRAEIDSSNARQLGIAATQGVKQAVDYQGLPDLGFRQARDPRVDTVSASLTQHFAVGSAGAPAPPITCTNGSFTEITNPDDSTTVTFNRCDIEPLPGFVMTLDGVVNSSSSDSANITTVNLEYVDFTIELLGEVTLLNFEASCDTDNTTTEITCAFPGVVGFDGRIYDLSDASVSGDAFSGYSVTATIVDPDHGSFTIATISPIVFGCPDEQPLSGQLEFTDGAGVLVTVTFNDCASFTVSYSGTAELYNW
jgi:hypothetical protein